MKLRGQHGPTGFDRVTAVVIATLALVLSMYALVATRGMTSEPQAGDRGAMMPVDFTGAASEVMPSLVKIENLVLSRHPAIPQFGGGEGEVPAAREGAGFFISRDGLIVTNFHVVDGAEVLRVVTMDRREYDASVVGADALTDIALVRIKPDAPAVPVRFGDSDALKVGQWVLAMGNPLGLEFFTTAGIISGFGPPGRGYLGFYDFIQTDANIKPGNSGGPLVDHRGSVVGVHTAYLGPGSGIGFAIPVNRVRKILDQLEKDGHVSRGFMGLIAQPVTEGLAARLGLKGLSGAVLSGVAPDGPAGKAGLTEGDVVLMYGDRPVKDDRELYESINSTPPGKKVTLGIVRDGLHKDIAVTLGELRPTEIISQRVIRQCGLTLQEVDKELSLKLSLDGPGGLLVLKVVPGCPSFEAGLQFGDVIMKVEGEKVYTVSGFYRAFSKVKAGEHVLIQILRGGRPQLITLRQPE